MNVKEQMDYDALKRELADCKAALSRRADKVEPVNEEALSLLDYAWTIFCNAGGGDWDKESVDWVKAVQNFEIQWRKLRFPEAAKVEKVEPVANGIENCHKCGSQAVAHWSTVTHDYMVHCSNCGESCAFHLTKARAIEVWNDTQKHEAAKPKPANVTITNPCGHGCNKVGIDCDNCADKPVKDNPQTTGERAITIPTLADVPIGAVAVIRTAKAVWESLVVAKSAGYTFVGNSIKWPDTRIVERWYWPGNRENRMREGK